MKHAKYASCSWSCAYNGDQIPNKSKSQLCYDRRSVGQSVLMSGIRPKPMTKFLLLSDSCRFVDVGRPPWRENGSVVYSYNCYWASPAQSSSGHSNARWPHFTVSHFRLSQPGRPDLSIYITRNRVAQFYRQTLGLDLIILAFCTRNTGKN
jgi:hypothetical protein